MSYAATVSFPASSFVLAARLARQFCETSFNLSRTRHHRRSVKRSEAPCSRLWKPRGCLWKVLNLFTRVLPPPELQNFWSLALSIRSSTGHIKTQHTSSRPYAIGARNENCITRALGAAHTALPHSQLEQNGRRPRPPLRERPPEQS